MLGPCDPEISSFGLRLAHVLLAGRQRGEDLIGEHRRATWARVSIGT